MIAVSFVGLLFLPNMLVVPMPIQAALIQFGSML